MDAVCLDRQLRVDDRKLSQPRRADLANRNGMPAFSALGANEQAQRIHVLEGVVFSVEFGVTNCRIGQRHGYIPSSRSIEERCTVPAMHHLSGNCYEQNPDFEVLKIRGCWQISVEIAGTKKEAEASIF